MRNLTRPFYIALIAILSAALSFTACSDDDEDNNDNIESSGTVELATGDSYSLSQGVLQLSNEGDSFNTYALILGSSGLDWETFSGIGEVVWLVVYSDQKPLTNGTFTLNTSPQANTIDSAFSYFAVQANPVTMESEVAYKFMPGQGDSLTISKDGDTYEINAVFPVAASDEEQTTITSISVNYSGELIYDEAK
ncbi:hypothetical protein [Salinivirga cyanobacteriivorans]